MSLIPPEDLPQPLVPAGSDALPPPPSPVHQYVAPSPRPAAAAHDPITRQRSLPRSKVGAIAGAVGAVVTVGGLAIFNATRGDDAAKPASSTPAQLVDTSSGADDGVSSNEGVSVDDQSEPAASADFASAYTALFGTSPSSSVVDCLNDQFANSNADLRELSSASNLSFDQALVVFTPFAACAPDDDFAAQMGSMVNVALNAEADSECVDQTLRQLGTSQRAQMYVELYLNSVALSDSWSEQFASCLP
jgi:hypothetical protein